MREVSITILSLSLLTVMVGAAIAPALSNLEEYFNEANITLIKLIVTIPSLFIIPSTIVVSKLSHKYSKKSLIMLGLSLYLVGGVGGAFVNNISILLFFRAVLGIGVGFIMPLTTSLISDYFEGEKRATMMGRASASNNFGGIISLLLSGWLAAISWRYSFSVYLIGLIVLLLVWLFLPNEQKKTDTINTGKSKLPKRVYVISISMFLIIIAFYSIPANIAIYVNELSLGDSTIAGVVISFISISGFIAGFLYRKIKVFLIKMFVPTLFLLMSIGFYLIGTGTNLFMICAGVLIMGTGMGLYIPDLFLAVSNSVDKKNTVTAMSIVSSTMFLGQFFSPIFLDFISEFFGNGNIRFPYLFLSVTILIFALSSFFTNIFKKSKKVSQVVS
ncbi:MFS transporter [Chengkuizengella axinellae]|uniref:MFS transporter n=1 Tax=Chengkuizengella axinellae TaxID=3064388 RepID=A0ABT9ITY5_9BACL|nr:MFS transporter [Chengkuizengella sp. 2205SS18-9]MDP5272793.1 MFS transporter [Chengkuizengella sp. 2205SS18-9]